MFELTRKSFLKATTVAVFTASMIFMTVPSSFAGVDSQVSKPENLLKAIEELGQPNSMNTIGQSGVLEAIFTRRSVRSFEDTPVTDEEINVLIRAAMQAPSPGNAQQWEFIIVTDKEKIGGVSPELAKHAPYAKGAPLAILVAYNNEKFKHTGYSLETMGAVTQNILIAAQGIGLGAIWTGVDPASEESIQGWQKYFNMPENIVPFSYVLVGKAKTMPEPKDSFDSSKVRVNNW